LILPDPNARGLRLSHASCTRQHVAS